jgi:hypothetical protein
MTANSVVDFYSQAANSLSTRVQPSIQRYLKRLLTDDEKKRLASYWLDALKELMPMESIAEVIASTIANHFTDDEINEIIRFYDTPVGQKLLGTTPILTKEVRKAERELIAKMADKETLKNLMEKFRKAFPEWLPKNEGA